MEKIIKVVPVKMHTVYYLAFIFFVSVAIAWIIGKYQADEKWKALGSRFTGEDMIWILENSNIELKDNDIIGEETPFRDYVRGGIK